MNWGDLLSLRFLCKLHKKLTHNNNNNDKNLHPIRFLESSDRKSYLIFNILHIIYHHDYLLFILAATNYLHWILNYRKSSRYFSTFLWILPIFCSYDLGDHAFFFRIIPSASTMTSTTITIMFHIFLASSISSFSFDVTAWPAGIAKFPKWHYFSLQVSDNYFRSEMDWMICLNLKITENLVFSFSST